MQRALGALAILASQVACKPLEQLQIRQVASTNSSFAAVVTPAPGDGSVLASNISVAADAGVVTALAAATVINEATTCSLSSVAEYTSTEFITLIDRTTPLYTLKVKPTIACLCDEGHLAGVGTSVGADGTPSYTCQLGQETGNPVVGTAPHWEDVTCSFSSLTDNTNNPLHQWQDAQADAAWKDMVEQFSADRKGLNLTSFAANFFNAPPGLSCEFLGNEICDNPINCGEGGGDNAPVNSPAGYMIINGIVSLHHRFDIFYEGLNNALGEINAQITTFTDTFSPINAILDAQRDTKLALDGIQLGLGILAAFTLSSWFQNLNFFKNNPNFLGVTGDISYQFIGTSFAFVKDAMETQSSLPIQGNISDHVGQVVKTWVNNTSGMVSNLFTDADALYEIIKDGKTFEPQLTQGPVELTILAEKASLPARSLDAFTDLCHLQAIFANTIPMAWTLGAEFQMPVILTSDGVHTDGTGCDGFDPSQGTGSDRQIQEGSEDIWSAGKFCVADASYWMVGVNMDPKNECADWDSSGCSVTGCQPRCLFTKPKFTTIKGLDSFDGERWGGLEALDLFSNAYNSWDANGRKNGWATADVTTREGVEQLVDGDITRAKGLVSIPICSFREALDTLYGLPTRRM